MAFSQPFNTSYKQVNSKLGIHQDVKGTPDTLWQYLDRATRFYIWSFTGYGAVCPDNTIASEVGMHYTYAPTGVVKVTDFLVSFAQKKKIGTADSHTAMVYATGADSLPTGAALGTVSYTTDDADTSAPWTLLTFGTAPTITGNFVAALSGLGTNNDTTWVLGDSVSNGMHEGRYMINYSSAWTKLKAISPTWDADFMILPILDITIGVENSSVKNNGLTLYGNYPNPATSVSTIKYELSQPSTVTIKVFDLKGNVVALSTQDMPQGIHTYDLNVHDIASGNYFYTVSTKIGSLSSKISVSK
jgi:hypothetical protein